MWSFTVENPMSGETRMVLFCLPRFTFSMALQTWGQLWLFAALEISLSDLLVVLAR